MKTFTLTLILFMTTASAARADALNAKEPSVAAVTSSTPSTVYVEALFGSAGNTYTGNSREYDFAFSLRLGFTLARGSVATLGAGAYLENSSSSGIIRSELASHAGAELTARRIARILFFTARGGVLRRSVDYGVEDSIHFDSSIVLEAGLAGGIELPIADFAAIKLEAGAYWAPGTFVDGFAIERGLSPHLLSGFQFRF